MRKTSLFCFLFIALIVISCRRQPDAHKTTPYHLDIPPYFPTKLNIPDDNPMTEEGVALGRYLFYDGRLSGRLDPDSMMCCASCHRQESNFEAGADHPIFQDGFVHGITGIPTAHTVLPLINLVWNNSGYGWNGFVSPDNEDLNQRSLEDVVRNAVMAKDEIAGDTSRIVKLFQQTPGYPELFYKAFGSSTITFHNIEKAIAQFIRSLTTTNSKFDRYLRGEEQLSQEELNGYLLFITEEGADCFHCHGGGANPLFTTNLFYNNGLDSIHCDPYDRYSVTGDVNDRGAYKAPSLRNINLSGPYMHDGRFATLDEVIDFYSENVKWSETIDPLMHHVMQQGVQLTDKEKRELKAFLQTLHDEEFLKDPRHAQPQQFPDERQ